MPGTRSRRPPTRGDAETRLFNALTTPIRSGKDWVQIAVTIPKGHLRVLDTEAELLGLRRSQFLELLFLNKLGQRVLTRPPVAPTYRFLRGEQAETVRYLWYLRRVLKKYLEEYLLKVGIKPSAFVVLMLNEWAHLGPDEAP
jgi:hypothetical protein